MRFRASDVAAATGGRLVGNDVDLAGATFDSRLVAPGQLFVPIVADRDGHDFVAAAAGAGAGAYLTARPPDPAVAIPAIAVDDTGEALMTLAAWAVRRLEAPVVAITGSVGKTTTKDLAAAAIGATRRVTANARSFNNEQGLPVTVLGAADDTEILVLEMGMRGFGEIARLAAVAPPAVGIVTSVGPAHGERVGGIEGVARAKAELVEALESEGTAVLNADDPRVRAMAERTTADVLLVGESSDADVRVEQVRLDDVARATFRIHTPWGADEVRLAVSGRHMAIDAALAVAAAGLCDVPLYDAVTAIAGTEVSPGRMRVHHLASGAIVVDDAYNANPVSMRAGLDALAAIDARRRVAVLGVMAELAEPQAAHREIAEHAAGLGIELIAVGTELYGVAPVDDAAAALGPLEEGTAVLVKGSLVAGLQALAAQLVATG